MDQRRLLKLAEFLKGVPQKQFDLSDWLSGIKPGECNTVSCACGWATVALPGEGLTLRVSPFGGAAIGYNGYGGWHAIQAFLTLT